MVTENALRRGGFADERRQFLAEARALERAQGAPGLPYFVGACDGLRPAVATERCFAGLRTYAFDGPRALSYDERLALTIQVAEALLAAERALGGPGRFLCDHHYRQYVVCADATGAARVKLADLDSLSRRGAQGGRRCAGEPADFCARGCDSSHGPSMANEHAEYSRRGNVPHEFACVEGTCAASDARLNAFRACAAIFDFIWWSGGVPPSQVPRLRAVERSCANPDPSRRASLAQVAKGLRGLDDLANTTREHS